MGRARPEVKQEVYEIRKAAAALERIWKDNRMMKREVWDGKFTQKTAKGTPLPKVSLCTTSMNRLHNIRATLPKNIQDNLDYLPNVEFVLLDYNSFDGLDIWVKENMMPYIESGILNYYRTEEPRHYSMSHSRNVAFKVAQGKIVNNIDADAYTNAGFAAYVARLSLERSERAFFAKSRQLLRGRLGFYKDEFIELLGGYNEELQGYGHDDQDLMIRAWEMEFKMMAFRGSFSGCVDDHIKHESGNYKEDWWWTECRNRLISWTNIFLGKLKANEGREWGKAKLIKNFTEEVEV